MTGAKRNLLCECGSGKKYKACCYGKEAETKTQRGYRNALYKHSAKQKRKTQRDAEKAINRALNVEALTAKEKKHEQSNDNRKPNKRSGSKHHVVRNICM